MWVWITVLTIIGLIVWQNRRKTAEARRQASLGENRRINAIAVPATQRFALELTSIRRKMLFRHRYSPRSTRKVTRSRPLMPRAGGLSPASGSARRAAGFGVGRTASQP